MNQDWPALDYAADRPVIETLHAYLQVVGKLPTRGLPWCNHSWHAALRVVPRGFRTYPVACEGGEAELLVDCLASTIRCENSLGYVAEIALEGQSVAEFHEALGDLLESSGVVTSIDGAPNEVVDAAPFARDKAKRVWNAGAVRRMHAAFGAANRVFELFRTGFVGKASPSHLFWGSFDLAVSRFSGRPAPLHPGGFPNLPDAVTQEAYSHEVASAGFWLGGNGVDEAAFYAYGYPTPENLAASPVEPQAAGWNPDLGEFILPYAAVQQTADPQATLLRFLESTYSAVADSAGWPRSTLEIPQGSFGRPYDVAALRLG